MRGGYQILDLKKVNLVVGETPVVSEAYETLEGNYGKAVLVTGLKVADSEVGDFYALPYILNSNYVVKVVVGDITYTITINADDEISLAQG